MRFEWDEEKRQLNGIKHGVDFPTAVRVLLGETVVLEDTRRDYGEKRYLAYGRDQGRLLVVVFTVRDDAVRIISARKANARERRQHDRGQQ